MAVEDFDAYNAYADEVGQNVWDVWADGFGGNGTGSTAGYLQEPFMSRGVVVGVGQALPLGYDNTGAFVDAQGSPASSTVSAISRAFVPPPDLTRDGATAVTLWVRGDQANTAESADVLYMGIKDTAGQEAMVTVASADALLKSYWQQKTINLDALAGVDLTRVSEIVLGVGNPDAPQIGGSGIVLIDDILLTAE